MSIVKGLVTVLSIAVMIQASHAQIVTLTGQVRDSLSSEPLAGANVTIKSPDDSLIMGVATDLQGRFNFNRAIPVPFKIEITHLGYVSYKHLYTQPVTDIGKILLAEDKRLLETVTVQGQIPIGETKGDTIAFNAQAFKVKEGADTEELIQKMPGITVENGTVKAQGEDVQRVLVDGRPFFGDDPTLALRNLPAEVVERIEVFDQLSEQAQFTGFDDGQNTRTINIVTRSDRRNGEFGKVFASAGTDERYAAGGNVNVFKGTQRTSFIGMSNNINQQNFSTQDLLGVVGSSGGGRRAGGGRGGTRGGGGGRGQNNSTNNFMVGQQGGINTTHSAGVNFSDVWNKKLEINGSYFFNASANESSESTYRTYFTQGINDQRYQELSTSEADNYNHRLNVRMNYSIDEYNSLLVRPSINFQSNNTVSNLAAFNAAGSEILSQTDNRNSANTSGYNVGNELLYRHRFAKRGRTVSLSLRTTWSDRDGERLLFAVNTDDRMNVADTMNQQSKTSSGGFNYNTSFVYTEPMGEKGQLQLNYNFGNNISTSDQYTYRFNPETGYYSLLDTALSNVFDNDYKTHRAGAGYRYNAGKLNLTINLSYQRASLINDASFPVPYAADYMFDNFLPSVTMNYRFGTGRNVRFNYRTNTNAPSINQLQNVINNTNPLQLSSGNPSLNQQYGHQVVLRYTSINAETSRNLVTFFSAGLNKDYIGNSTVIASGDTVINNSVTLPTGGQYSYPVNLNRSWNLRTFITYGFRLPALKSNFNFNLSFNYAESPSLINYVENINSTTSLVPGLSLTSNVSDKLDFTVSTSRNFNVVRNSLQPQLNNDYAVQNTSAKVYWNFWKNLFVDNALVHQVYSGLEDPYNQSIVLWNASVGARFLKDNRGELKLMIYDLLNQNTNIQRSITESYSEDTQTRILQQYFLLSFTYRFVRS